MTISSTVRIAGPFIGTGTATVFPYAFKIFAASNLQVVRADSSTGLESTLILNTDYTVSLNTDQDSNPGGNVTLLAVLAVGFTMVITSDIANLQPTDLTNQGGFYPEVITDALDRATIQIQQMADELTRSIKIPISDGLSLDMELPTAAARANSFLAFDATGEPTVVTAGSSGAPTTITRQQFSGTGSQVAFTLASDPGALGNSCEVFIGGIYQQRDTYTIAGTTLTFTAAPVAGTDNIEVVNFLTSAIGTTDSSLVTFVPAGTGATMRTAQAKFRDTVSVKDFGAVGDGVADDTAAIQAAIDSSNPSNSKTSIYVPAGKYRITSTLFVNKNHTTIFGDGIASNFYFDPTTSPDQLFLIQNANPASLISGATFMDFSISAKYPTPTITKHGFTFVDAGTVLMSNVVMYDFSWVGNDNSIGIVFAGRDTHKIVNCLMFADLPIYIKKNPNSSYYTFDYQTFTGLYCSTLCPNNYAITFEDGVNPTNWVVNGNSGCGGGKGGIYLNNTTSTLTSSMIMIDGFRCESGTASGGSAGGYGMYLNFGSTNPKCGNISIKNCSVNDPTCNGFYFDNVSTLVAENVNCGFAALNNAFICTRVSDANITSLGISDDAAIVQFNSMYEHYFAPLFPATPANKSVSFGIYKYYSADTPTQNKIYQNGVRTFYRTESTTNSVDVALPALTSGQSMMVHITCDFGYGIYYVAYPNVAPTLIAGSAGFGVQGSGNISCTSVSAGSKKLSNLTAGTQTFVISVTGS
jgi:hypothetical protein